MLRQVTDLPVTEQPVADGNWDTNRVYPIDKVIIHTIVGTIASANSRFNSHSSVSAHYGIGEGGSITHWVDEDNVAYQAGDYAVNQSSIGIEHEDNGDYNGTRPDALYTSSAKLVNDICNFYQIPIDRDHIKKHSEVSDSPTACPDALDIDRIVREALALNNPQPAPYNQDDYVHFNATDPNQIEVNLDQYGWMERQAIKGKLGDLDKLSNQVTVLNQQIVTLQSQIDQLSVPSDPETPPDSSSTPPVDPITVPTTSFWQTLWDFLVGLLKKPSA